MNPDDAFERALQSLLEGAAVPQTADGRLRIIDAIARAHGQALGVLNRVTPADGAAPARWGHLDVRGEIGRGSTGVVYRAWDTRLERHVALKLLSDVADIDAALAEGRLLARLNHPNIVQVFGADTHDGVPGVWMELLEGYTLDEVVTRDGPMGPEDACLVVLDIARALTAVHAAGLLHRDVKARNVVRERGGRIVLMDLGGGRELRTRNAPNDALGTPLYMAPELLSGGTPTPASDVYALGVLAYRLLTGTYPVVAASRPELESAHRRGSRRQVLETRADVPHGIAAVVDRACAAAVDQRFESTMAFESALDLALDDSLRARASVASPQRRAWRQWRLSAARGVAALSVIALVGWGAWDTAPARALRRHAGLPVGPRGSLYMTMEGGMAVLRHGTVRFVPASAYAHAIAVDERRGVWTMTSRAPWAAGAHYTLDGVEVGPSGSPGRLCCFFDGTSDGRAFYAVRQDSTFLEAPDSRPLAPPAIFRFDGSWASPRLHFALSNDGEYAGVTFEPSTGTFFLTRQVNSTTYVDAWRDGHRVRTIAVLPHWQAAGIAFDPADDTLWLDRPSNGVVRLGNLTTAGGWLGEFTVPLPVRALRISGMEFALGGAP